jgi:peptidoglycan/LPS O-acetylase OafA/YrhL
MSGRFEGADGIRGVACLIVICIHAIAIFFPSTRDLMAGAGKIGVWLFFVLSAFLLTSKFMRSGFERKSVGGYAAGRFLRIIPIFFLVVFLYYFQGGIGITTFDDLVDALTFGKGYGHLWTIPAEFKFYLILPFIAYAIIAMYRKFGFWSAGGGCLAIMAFQQFLWPYWLMPENSIDTRWYLSSFTIGSFCSVVHHQFRDKLTEGMADILGLAVIALVALSFPYPRHIFLGMPIDKWLMDKFLLFSPLWAIFILVLADGKGYLGGVLRTVALRKLGEWSFSIYLIHIMVYSLIGTVRAGSLLLMLMGIAFSVSAGALLYYCFEGPMERLRHKIQVRLFKT